MHLLHSQPLVLAVQGREQPGEQLLKESMEVKHTNWEGKRPWCSNEQLLWQAGTAELQLSLISPDTAV